VDYSTDFKGRVGEVLGLDREALCTQVWAILREIRDWAVPEGPNRQNIPSGQAAS
jgi:hypothetical protein